MGQWECARWRGKRGVVTLRPSQELSFWEREGCRWRMAKDGRCVASDGRERGNKPRDIPFAGYTHPPVLFPHAHLVRERERDVS